MDAAAVAQFEADSRALAEALHSGCEPRCVARTFATAPLGTLHLTLQQWIDLAAIRSPLLTPAPLENDADLLGAAEVFALDLTALDSEEIARTALAMEAAAIRAFAMALPMRHPKAESSTRDDGFGDWLPLLAFLMVEAHVAYDAALALRVDRAFALLAAIRANQGWEVAGTPYALRDLEEEKEAARG